MRITLLCFNKIKFVSLLKKKPLFGLKYVDKTGNLTCYLNSVYDIDLYKSKNQSEDAQIQLSKSLPMFLV